MANTIISGVTILSEHGVAICTFSGITASASFGTYQSLAQYPDKVVHVYGTFSGSTSVSIRGSNDPTQPGATGGNSFILISACGAALTFTTQGMKQVLPNTKWLAFRQTGAMTGAGVSVHVEIVAQSPQR